MKKHRPLIRLLVLLICFGLVWPLESSVFAMQRRATPPAQKKGVAKKGVAKKGAAKKVSAKSRLDRVSRSRLGSREQATTPRPAFDKIMSENRALLSESSDAELAASQIEESKLRANVKYLADDLLEGRGPGSRGGT